MPRSAHGARLAAAPSRALWPRLSRPTKPPRQRNATATDAAPQRVPAPSLPPSAPRSCARTASPSPCSNPVTVPPGPHGRSRSQAPRHKPQTAIQYLLLLGDPFQHPLLKFESLLPIAIRCIFSDSVRVLRREKRLECWFRPLILTPTYPLPGSTTFWRNKTGNYSHHEDNRDRRAFHDRHVSATCRCDR